jgi:hypothetical protein
MPKRPDFERAAASLQAAQEALNSVAENKDHAKQKTQLQLLAEEAEDIYVQLKMIQWRLDASE